MCPRELPDSVPVCTACLSDRPVLNTGTSKCDVCHEPMRTTQLTKSDPQHYPPSLWRCASCHVAFLKARAEADPIIPADFARCKAKLAEAYARAGAKWETKRPEGMKP